MDEEDVRQKVYSLIDDMNVSLKKKNPTTLVVGVCQGYSNEKL